MLPCPHMQPKDPIQKCFRISETQKRALNRVGLNSVLELLRHVPSRYESVEDIKRVRDLRPGETAIVYGKLSGLSTRKAFRRKTPIAEGFLRDETGKIKIIWFNQPYLAKLLREGVMVKVAGKVAGKEGKLYIGNPETAETSAVASPDESLFESGERQALYPVYPESRGITSKWFYYTIQKIFKNGMLEKISDPIPQEILAAYHLPKLSAALLWAHAPRRAGDAAAARKRFAFEEVFLIQLGKQQLRRTYDEAPAFEV